MSSHSHSQAAVQEETAEIDKTLVERLIRLTHRSLDQAGHVVSPAKVSKTVRQTVRQMGPSAAAAEMRQWVASLSQAESYNPDVTLPLTYQDPTGDTAARNIDRAKKKAPDAASTASRGQSHQNRLQIQETTHV